ncbi:uncharacterized protein LOC135945348 [Cloeon dipterum]|uniref:uncharacterized protein LOC135945348 n=1 Tax=Cloeon dipterum TaxID=197152 RepID=UPI0032208DF0
MAFALSTISKLFTEDVLNKVVQNALQSTGKSDLHIASYQVEPGADKGTGYMGIVYRIRVTLSDGSELTLIGKGMPQNMVRRKTFRSEPFFRKEVMFFNHLAPMLRQLELKQRGEGAKDTFLPISECYYAMSDGENDFLVFQDLKSLGYEMADRISGPTEAQRNSLLHTLAKFHALSFALQTLQPETFSEAVAPIYEPWFAREFSSFYAGYLYKLFGLWHRAVHDQLKGTHYLSRFERLGANQKVFFDNLCDSLRLLQPAVINHGDAWSTNFMFKGHQVMMIDFQLVRYCSAMTDLSMFIFNCTTEEQRAAAGGTEAILKEYYQVLCGAVAQLGLPECPLSWQQLMEQWCVNGLLGFGGCLELVPLSLVESEDVQDLDRVEGNEPIPLDELTQFSELTKPEHKKRLVDLIRLAVDYNMF